MARILIVDDDRHTCELLRHILEAASHEVQTAYDGSDAAQLFRTQTFDLVMTDIYMPERDGFDVMRDVRKQQPNVPIIIFTGQRDLHFDPLKMADRLGADMVMRKPIVRATVLSAVEQVLNGPRPAVENGTTG
ncbi:response regulator [Roseiterribacter gracilis]|uniref:Response regulator n=1 Tax=Roseiterribacter gracilis TaxID=2812848 RepID=A0A8S8X7R8_9PROT|nr:response regulator [Rhodospirillales bacterium TMPK1]